LRDDSGMNRFRNYQLFMTNGWIAACAAHAGASDRDQAEPNHQAGEQRRRPSPWIEPLPDRFAAAPGVCPNASTRCRVLAARIAPDVGHESGPVLVAAGMRSEAPRLTPWYHQLCHCHSPPLSWANRAPKNGSLPAGPQKKTRPRGWPGDEAGMEPAEDDVVSRNPVARRASCSAGSPVASTASLPSSRAPLGSHRGRPLSVPG
jgi:hypothetical protein